MNESDDLGKAVDQAEDLFNTTRLVQLTIEEGDNIMAYLVKRLTTPVVGLAPSAPMMVITNLDEHPFGSLVVRLVKTLGGSKSDTLSMWMGDQDFELLSKDIDGQMELGDLSVLEKAKSSLKSIRGKWEGAVG